MSNSPLTKVADISQRQLGLVTSDQFRERSVSKQQVFRLRRRGLITQVRRGVDVVVGAPPTWEQALLAAVLAGTRAFASNSAAARLWQFAHAPEPSLELVTDRPRFPRLEGVAVHRTTVLLPGDVARRGAVPCTSFERTLCDCTTIMSEFQLGRALDDGLRRKVATIERLALCHDRLSSGPLRRLRVVRRLLAERGAAYDPGGSSAELDVLRVLRKAGLPRPVQQYRVRIGGRFYILDYAYPDLRIAIEYYGLAIHSLPSSVAYDSDKISDLAADGWLPVILHDHSSATEIVERVSRALAERGAGVTSDLIVA